MAKAWGDAWGNTWGTSWGEATAAAPILSVASYSNLLDVSVAVSVVTDKASGTLYMVITQSATQPSAAQIKAGQNHLSAAADANDSVSVTDAGTRIFAGQVVVASTTYYAHFIHEDSVPQDSNIITTIAFTTLAVPPTGIEMGSRVVSLPVTFGVTRTLTQRGP
jgi:hypothetical protein